MTSSTVEYNALPDTVLVILEVVFTANHLTDTDKWNTTGKYTKYIKLKKQTVQNTVKQNYPGSVASYDTRPGNEMGLFYNIYLTKCREPLL